MAWLAMARYRKPNVEQLRFIPLNFAELFLEDHPLSQLLATIRELDLSEFDAGYKNDSPAGGRPADSCERILAVLLYWLLYVGLSMRNLQREPGVRADLLYLSGGMIIDHTTFSVFRERHHTAILRLFGQTVFLGAQAGVIDLETVCIDSTKIKAWANRRDIGDSEGLARRYNRFRGSARGVWQNGRRARNRKRRRHWRSAPRAWSDRGRKSKRRCNSFRNTLTASVLTGMNPTPTGRNTEPRDSWWAITPNWRWIARAN